MAQKVSQAMYYELDGQLTEIKRQLRQHSGYPYDPEKLRIALQAVIEGQFVISTKPSILEHLGTITIPDMPEFIAKEKFVTTMQTSFLWVGGSFERWFLEKREGPIAEMVLHYAELLKHSVDESILVELGGESSEVTLSQVYALLEHQANGEDGVLLTNGWANIFYVRAANGMLRGVTIRRRPYDWYMAAFSIVRPFGWRKGSRVFFHPLV